MIREAEVQRYDIGWTNRIERLLDSSAPLRKYFGDWNHRYITGDLVPRVKERSIYQKGWSWAKERFITGDQKEESESLLKKQI